jgi:hypothetical protein
MAVTEKKLQRRLLYETGFPMPERVRGGQFSAKIACNPWLDLR